MAKHMGFILVSIAIRKQKHGFIVFSIDVDADVDADVDPATEIGAHSNT